MDYYIRTRGKQILRKECVPITDFSDVRTLFVHMVYFAAQTDAAGIAAPQVGDSRRFFLTNINSKVKKYFNPKIILAAGDAAVDEKYLSLPGEKVEKKPRYNTIALEYQDGTGRKHKRIFSGFEAIVIQHEINHLDGVLMTDNKEKRKYF